MTNWMIEDKGTFPSLDVLLAQAQEASPESPIDEDQVAMIITQSNEYTDSLRKQ
jgi:hypothetical protein